jgi:type IX secretion system PorP/SprF family membrane protein
MKRRYLIGLILLFNSYIGISQDVQFTQYYAAPMYLNPAFAGTTPHHRFILNYRNQWPNLPRGFVNYTFSYDYNMSHLKSGIGVMASVDRAGSANLQTTNLGIIYAYKVQLHDKWVFSPGLYFGLGTKNIDFNKLVFGDQLEFDDQGNVPTQDLAVSQNIDTQGYIDVGSGFLIYNKNIWAGASFYHINKPNQSLLGEESELPMKTSVHAGIRIPLYHGPFKRARTSSIAPSFVYKSQGNFSQLDLGLHFLYEPVMIGLWYRGIPIKQNAIENVSQDAMAIILGMQFSYLEIGYSYDFTISELGPIAGGAHEVSLQYRFDIEMSRKVKKKDKFIPCPTFMKN